MADFLMTQKYNRSSESHNDIEINQQDAEEKKKKSDVNITG